jgi:DNA-binding NtrC family response regulator
MPRSLTESKVLVVDDDRSLADNLVAFLSKLGYGAEAAYGGEEALEAFRKDAYDLVITDLMMPGVDGMELLKAMRTIAPKTIVLVITGHGSIESAVEAIRKGAFDFIPKPFKLSELEVIVERAFKHREMSKQLGLFRGLTLGLIVSMPVWLVLGIVLAWLW